MMPYIFLENLCMLQMYGCKYADSMFLSDRYHFEHNGTCDGVDPYASTTKVSSYQTEII